jgi:3-deoxy-D-manno-octulosonic-acid transferase
MVLYKLFLFCYPKIAKLLALFNPKAKQWCIGQRQVWEEISLKSKQIQGPTIWIHAASYGEFEQGLPIIEALKLKYPDHQVWVTFFSPSGYLNRKNDPLVDMVTYLPFDGPENAKKFISIVNPKLIVFIKYEFWYYYLNEAKSKNIPIILASAIFRENQIFFKWYGAFYKNMLSLFSNVLMQDKESYNLVAPLLTNSKISITGDTRFDRVVQTANITKEISWIALLSSDKKIIAGSTWKEDDFILSKATAHFTQFNWIIVPHHVDQKNIANCKSIFQNSITLTQLLNNGIKLEKPMIIIVDSIGLLRTLYQYAFVTYVGGGFGSDGVHNVLEPAAFSKPVIWGQNDLKYREAIGLRENGGGFRIKNEAELVMHLNEFVQSTLHYDKVCSNAKTFIQNNAGATTKTMSVIEGYLD